MAKMCRPQSCKFCILELGCDFEEDATGLFEILYAYDLNEGAIDHATSIFKVL